MVCLQQLNDMYTVAMIVADREVQRILLELLNQMDGFDQSVNVKVNLCIIQFSSVIYSRRQKTFPISFRFVPRKRFVR